MPFCDGRQDPGRSTVPQKSRPSRWVFEISAIDRQLHVAWAPVERSEVRCLQRTRCSYYGSLSIAHPSSARSLSQSCQFSSMSLSNRKAAAARFRQHIQRSNELHVGYLQDARLLSNYDRFANWQLAYLLPFFSDLHARDGYSDAIDFTMSDLAGIGISSRDRDLERAAPAITTMLPLRALVTIAAAAELNARVLEINIGICRCLLVGNELPARITELEYSIACRKASSLGECVELVHLITGLGRTLKSLVTMPMIGITLRTMRAPAHAAGFGALQEFLEKGYRTFKQIPDIDHFLSEIETRMIVVFERIYTAPLDQLR